MPYFPPAGGNVLLPNSVSDDYLADMPAGTVKGRLIGTGTGDPQNLTSLQVLANLGVVFTQCQFYYVSTSVCRLGRWYGCLLTIDNVPQVIPVAGVDIAPTGLTPSTVYFIYAYMSAGVMRLEASATTYTVDPRNGLPVKTGDPTRTLVGVAQPQAGPTWRQDASFLLVLSYYNRKPISFGVPFSWAGTALTPYVVTPAVWMLSWGDNLVHGQVTGNVSHDGGAVTNVAAIYINETVATSTMYTQSINWVSSLQMSVTTVTAAHGSHLWSVRVSQYSAVSSTWNGSFFGWVMG